MKTILVLTDFTPIADNALIYAFHLARGLNAAIKICNVVKSGPTGVGGTVIQLLESKVTLLKREEAAINDNHLFRPSIASTNGEEKISDVIRQLSANGNALAVVLGVPGHGEVSPLLEAVKKVVIENGNLPMLLIPHKVIFKGAHKIAFAAQIEKNDIHLLHSLSYLAKPLNAEILIAHVTDHKYDSEENKHRVDAYLNEITGKINYSKIYYRHIKSMDLDSGLDWLCEHGMVDLLVMVHHEHSTIGKFLGRQHAKKLAGHIRIPLLILPEKTQVLL